MFIYTFTHEPVCVYIYIYNFEKKLIIFINFNVQKLPTLQSICIRKSPLFYYNFLNIITS